MEVGTAIVAVSIVVSVRVEVASISESSRPDGDGGRFGRRGVEQPRRTRVVLRHIPRVHAGSPGD